MASDFRLYEDCVKQLIVFFADTEEPINVALLLDTSKSTTWALDDIKQAAKDFVKQLRPQDRAMIVSFGRDTMALCELTSDQSCAINTGSAFTCRMIRRVGKRAGGDRRGGAGQHQN